MGLTEETRRFLLQWAKNDLELEETNITELSRILKESTKESNKVTARLTKGIEFSQRQTKLLRTVINELKEES